MTANKSFKQFKRILELVEQHDKFFSQSLNLIASENVPSPAVMKALVSDLNNRVAEGWIGERVYAGMHFYDEIEAIGIEVARNLFGFPHVDLRPISGTSANMAVYSAITKPGDTIMTTRISDGAHISMAGKTPKDIFGLQHVPLPFDPEGMNIDLDKTIKLIHEIKPRLIILGGSVILFPQPVKEIVVAAHKMGSIVLYDASHVAGLIAGNKFQTPFEDGVDIVTLTPCKTIPGPQGGIILSKDEFANKLKKGVFPTTTSGHHLHETVGAIIALVELQQYGESYASQVINNAKVLAQCLDQKGLKIVAKSNGFTESHMLVIDCEELGGGKNAEDKLTKANIIVNRNLLPRDNGNFKNPSGVRIGTPEVTHFGMKEREMKIIAKLVAQVLLEKEVDYEQIKKQILFLREKFNKIMYCFD